MLRDYLDVALLRDVMERQRMVNPRKAFPVDPGLIPVFDRTGRANPGHALETVVLVELERRRMEVTYVRTPGGYEVDFLARKPSRPPELIQVCADLGTARRSSDGSAVPSRTALPARNTHAAPGRPTGGPTSSRHIPGNQ
ncbi:MAG: ATP-binding protein [Verrucomicrobia bacterium]|nr:ATP-binding protein [Verrucomicrobiota bacterium]